MVTATQRRSPGRGRYPRELTPSARIRAQRALLLTVAPKTLLATFPEPCSVAAVLAATGVGRNTFYSHFSDIGAWRDAALRNCLRQLRAALPAPPNPSVTPSAALETFASEWWAALPGARDALRLVSLYHPQELLRACGGALSKLHLLGAKAGAYRANLPPEMLTAAAASLLALSLASEAEPATGQGRALEEILTRLFR